MGAKQKWFDEIYMQYRSLLLRSANGLVNDPAYAEDLVETVFEKLYNKYETVKNHPHIKGWLLKALGNQIKSEGQRAFRHREVAMEPDFEPASDPYREDFMKILPPGLSESERQILYLHIEAGFPHEEIAAMLKCSPTACRMRYSRAKRHCKKLLEENNREDLSHSAGFDKYKEQEVQ